MANSSVQGIKTVLHPVSDVEKAKAVYTALLGVEPTADSAYYVGFDVAGRVLARRRHRGEARRGHRGRGDDQGRAEGGGRWLGGGYRR